MACEAKQQTILLMEPSEVVECEEKRVLKRSEVYDEESRKFRRHMAQQEALHQLEQRKTQALASAYRMSFIR